MNIFNVSILDFILIILVFVISITILPMFLKQISFIFPFIWGIDIIRNLMLNTNTIFNFKFEFILLFIISILYLMLGVFSYKLLEKKARKIGVKGF